MHTVIVVGVLIACVMTGWSQGEEGSQTNSPMVNSQAKIPKERVKIPICDFTYKMEYKGEAVEDPGHWNWHLCTVQGDDGKFHGFGERAMESQIAVNPKTGNRCGMMASVHVNLCEIGHYVADRPEGPYRFVDVALPRGKQGEIGQSKIYPCVQRDGNRWVMMYTGLPGSIRMKGCLAVSDSLNGPWRDLGAVLAPSEDPKHFSYKSMRGIHIPQFISFRGKWYAYFKAGNGHGPEETDFLGVAVADRPEGPWVLQDRPAILKNGKHPGTYLEDHYEFVWKEKVYLLITEYGKVSGVGGLLLFESDDGLTFPFEKARLMVGTMPMHIPEFDPKRVKSVWAWGIFEAPHVLLINGVPSCFFGGGGTNLKGELRPSVHCLKINDWKP